MACDHSNSRHATLSRDRVRISDSSDFIREHDLSRLRSSDVAPVFFGGRLLALNKKSGSVRPIGFTLRRLASKCANAFGVNHLKGFLQPYQLRVGRPTPGGCEAAIHSARRYLEAL